MIANTDDATRATDAELMLLVDFVDWWEEPAPDHYGHDIAPPPPPWKLSPANPADHQALTVRAALPHRPQCRGPKPNWMERGKN